MILAFCFCTRDQDLALENLRWWNELGGCKGHTALVGYDPRCDPATVEAIRQEFVKAFDKVFKLKATAEVDGWPQGANYFMRVVAADLQDRKDCRCFVWMEPDAIPLREGWLDAIAAEYGACGKPFMGDRVEVENIPLHMSGVGVYWNPLHQKAGEAYRAHDTAWDMAAKDQIVPQAHFTKLIEHAWKHPSFTNALELQTQIRPEAMVFHSSKDGSLIRLLRAQKNFPVPVSAEPTPSMPIKTLGRQEGEAREDTTKTGNEDGIATGVPVPSRDLAAGETIYDIFIRTYAPDYDWLRYCVRAIDKFASGFRKVWIISPHNPPLWMLERDKGGSIGGYPIDWRVMNEEAPDGYLSQQIHKLYADAITGYEADYYLHIDSDVILTIPIQPSNFFVADKVIWPFTPYSAIETPWKPITEAFLGRPVEYEFMRRFPIMVPKWLYGKLRQHAHATHGRIISEYVRTRPHREFSEFNALGAYAYEFHREQFVWFNTITTTLDAPFGKQFHSWSGLTAEIKTEIETLLRPQTVTPVMSERAGSTPAAAPQIKKLPNDIWVIEGDQISGWVEEVGRLDHDINLLPVILSHINEGDRVVDCGAFIGDHAIAYGEKVTRKGAVYAFEPNPLAYECLRHNVKNLDQIFCFNMALGDKESVVPLSGNNNQPSGGYIGQHMKVADVQMVPLDALHAPSFEPDLIKIDVEGYELKVLQGAEKTIMRHRPKMVIEINQIALERQGNTAVEVFYWLDQHDYNVDKIENNAAWHDPLYNIIALPGTEESTSPVTAAEGSSKSPTAAPSVSGNISHDDMVAHVKALADYCTDGWAIARVRKQLMLHKIIKRKRK